MTAILNIRPDIQFICIKAIIATCQIHQLIQCGVGIQESDRNKQIRANNQDESDPDNLLKMFISY